MLTAFAGRVPRQLRWAPSIRLVRLKSQKVASPPVHWLKKADTVTLPASLKELLNQEWKELIRRGMPPKPMWYIKEEEIEEKFIKGGGPGGQKINKCNSKVQLIHKPTGMVINCQESRSQSDNRKKAREKLAMALEHLEFPVTSRQNFLQEKIRRLAANREKKKSKAPLGETRLDLRNLLKEYHKMLVEDGRSSNPGKEYAELREQLANNAEKRTLAQNIAHVRLLMAELTPQEDQ